MVRAAVLEGPGQAVQILDVELDDPREGEVEVAITAAGVCPPSPSGSSCRAQAL
jgi:Zn-dependent alcohol dehydrogenase